MILSTLGLSPHGFALGLYPKGLIPIEIFVHPYIPMILLISSQCGTLVVYPTVQSAGAAVAWHVDARKVPLLTQLIVNWSFTTVSYPLLAILAMLVIKDDHKGEEPSINPASMDNNSKPV